MFKNWLKAKEGQARGILSDFLTCVLGFDKIETVRRTAITTTCDEPYTRFYNYYLMDWNIDCYKPRYVYNEETGCFEFVKRNPFVWNLDEREIKSELDEIKANVLKKDRHYYFK